MTRRLTYQRGHSLFILVTGSFRNLKKENKQKEVPRFFYNYTNGAFGANFPQQLKTMKKLSLLLLTLTVCFFTACHKDIWAELENLDQRVTKLEELCKEMNTNITSLQTIVSVLQSNDFITGIVEIKKNGEVIGYTITFGKHDPITIYHGQDGKDGADGKDGQDGQNGSANTPMIGVAQDTDGVYYWTLNGEWLLDDNGNKLPVSGKDGQNGADGTMPQLKIEEGYWYVSYDNGVTWTQLGKATGEDGQNGDKGDKGDTGDSMFQSVTQDENYVYFTLADGTVIKIVKGNGSNDQPNSEFIFTITYNSNGGEGVMKTDTFYYGKANTISTCTFTKENYYCKSWNTSPTGKGITYDFSEELTIDKNITLYAQWYINSGTENEHDWVDLGLSIKWATMNIGANTSEEEGYYFSWGEVEAKNYFSWGTYKYCNGSETSLTKYCSDTYYGIVDNKMVLDSNDDAASVNWGGDWRMPTIDEIQELLTKCTWDRITQNGQDCWKAIGTNGNCLILPCTSVISNGDYYNTYRFGYYWTKNCGNTDAYALRLSNRTIETQDRYVGIPIRPVCPK